MKQLKVLAISSLENSQRIEALLKSESINRMVTLQPMAGNLERAAALPVDAVVMLSAVMTDEECLFMEKLYMTREKLAFILLCESPDAELLTRAMRAGITKVMMIADGPEAICAGIEDEIERVRSRRETAGIREFDSRVVSVFSTKGGTGKTTIAVNLAAALQKLGKRIALVDLDLQFGDVGIFMNVPRCDTISDLAGEAALVPSVVNSYLYRHSTGVQIMCAPVSPELAELVKTEHIDKMLNVLRAEFDYVICDLAPSLDDVTLFALDRSDTVYFITNPEVPTLKNTHTCLGVLNTLGYTGKIRLVLNRDGDAYVSRADVKTALNMEPYYCIPCDMKSASSAINRGLPVIQSAPRSKLSRALTGFAKLEAGLEGAGKKSGFSFGKKR